jgi:hypothetical protein
MIKSHHLFTLWRADEVAECLEGVPTELYQRLWNDFVALQKPIPNIEDTGPADHIGYECLAKYWDRLLEEEQRKLNELAAAHDEKYK